MFSAYCIVFLALYFEELSVFHNDLRENLMPYIEEWIRQIQARGTDAEIKVFDGLPHGFGLGEGTVAEG